MYVWEPSPPRAPKCTQRPLYVRPLGPLLGLGTLNVPKCYYTQMLLHLLSVRPLDALLGLGAYMYPHASYVCFCMYAPWAPIQARAPSSPEEIAKYHFLAPQTSKNSMRANAIRKSET